MRKPLRYAHLVVGLLLGAYIYSPTLASSATFEAIIRFGAFPLIALSGVAMWQQARIVRRLRRT